MKMRSLKMKFFVLTVILLSVYLFVFYVLFDVWIMHKKSRISSVLLPYVVVHIDLKGAPPKLSYLESLLPILKSHGANGLLMEYEDMFPYEGKLVNISAKNCYDKSELQAFLISAINLGFEIIPLVQTFGHLEHVLKLQEFQHLREMPLYPDSICPSKTESKALLRDMLQQMIFFHNSIAELKYIHIGCDEVYHINKCKLCTKERLTNNDFYISYVNSVSEIIRFLSPGTVVLIWDDMLRGIKHIEWEDLDHFTKIEPVYWDYQPNLRVSHSNLFKYRKKFDNIWIASAFKGADGRIATMPHFKNRFVNHFRWLNFILDYKFGGDDKVYNFRGIILTGWSRYSHMDPPCELLPMALPSLIINLLLIKKFQSGIEKIDHNIDLYDFFAKYLEENFNKSMQCSIIDLVGIDFSSCNFESHVLYTILQHHKHLMEYIDDNFNDEKHGLSSLEYYAKQGYMNLNTVMWNIKWTNDTLRELVAVEKKLCNALSEYYDKEVTKEYVNFKIYAGKKRLKDFLRTLRAFTKTRYWNRRPVSV